MYYYNMLQPEFICETAIKLLKQGKKMTRKEKEKLNLEIEALKNDLNSANKWIELENKRQELSMLNMEYSQTIRDMEQLKEFTSQQMRKIILNNEREGEIIF